MRFVVAFLVLVLGVLWLIAWGLHPRPFGGEGGACAECVANPPVTVQATPTCCDDCRADHKDCCCLNPNTPHCKCPPKNPTRSVEGK